MTALAPGLTPEMVAAVSKLCRLQDLGLRPAPEFEAWQHAMGITTAGNAPRLVERLPAAFAPALGSVGRVSTRQVD